MKRQYRGAAGVVGILLLASMGLADLPAPATGGRGGGPIDLLLLRGHAIMNFGAQPPLDATYQQKLTNAGYRITIASEWQDLTLDYLRQFNTVVYLNPSPYLSGGYFDATDWNGGWHHLTVRRNVGVLRQYVEAGGGLFILPAMEEAGMSYLSSFLDLLKPYGLRTECAGVRDLNHTYEAAKILNLMPVYYCWTEQLAKHGVTEGAKRIYYPGYATRWDDNYTTLPLFLENKAWIPLIRSMPGTASMHIRGSIYSPKTPWIAAPGLDNPAILAAREFGKGRLAVCGISPFILFYYTYSKDGQFAEANYSRVDGIAMEHGDGQTPSDLHRVLDNLYRWLAESSVAAGMGGGEAAGVRLPPADTSKGNEFYLSDKPAAEDPLMTNAPIRAMKILVGARSAISDGQGTPAEWAASAKAAGYDVVCFTETFEALKQDQWPRYVDDCRAASDDTVFLLPGLDYDTDLDNRILVVGYDLGIRRHVLTEDGKKLHWTGHVLLGMGDTLPIAARPTRLAAVRGKGRLPPDLYKHIPGIPVATYRDGKLVDDGRSAYEWHLYNASMPIPVAVHEVATPAELATAAKTGLQNRMPADLPAHAAFYFRQGLKSFGGNPPRYYLSSGPVLDRYGIDDWQSPNWKVALRAHADHPITEVTVRDQYGLYRRYQPDTNQIDLAWNGDLAVQRWFVTELTDAMGNKAFLARIRSLPRNAVVRCGDRQNWFAPLEMGAVSYTGMNNAMTKGPMAIAVPGVTLAAPYCPKVQFRYSGEGLVIHEFVMDSTLVPGARPPESDNGPIFNEQPIPEYAGVQRYTTYKTGRGLDAREYGVSIELKKDLVPQGDLWPIVASTTPKAAYVYNDPKTGARVEGALSNANTVVDLPAGAVVGNILLLTPLRAGAGGAIGFAPGKEARAGQTFVASVMTVDPAKRDDFRKAFGFDGPTPYQVTLSQGTLARTAFHLGMTAKDGGVAGQVKGIPAPILKQMPLWVAGINPRWPVGLWISTSTNLTLYGCYEGVGLGRLDVAQDSTFYFGNLVTAGTDELNIAFVSPWTQEGAILEVNNPTDRAIKTTIRSPALIQGRKRIQCDVAVPAGASVVVDVR